MATRLQASQYFKAKKNNNTQIVQADEFCMGILGLEKSKKRHPNCFKTRKIAIKAHEWTPTILLSSLLFLSPPPPPPPPLKKRGNWQQQKVLDSRTLQRSYFVTHYWRVNKHKHTAGKTLWKVCSQAKGPGTPHSPRAFTVDCQTSLWIWDLPVVSLKDHAKLYWIPTSIKLVPCVI